MAELPTIENSLGRRPVPTPQSGVRSLQGGDVGGALANLGQTVSGIGDAIIEREATAAAKERDTYVSDQLRDLMYNPETGFANARGRNAVARMGEFEAALERIENEATKGLGGLAGRKLEAALARRMESARDFASRHTSTERGTWLDGASLARQEAAAQDAIFNPLETKNAINTIEGEVLEMGLRKGWGTDEIEGEMDKRVSALYQAQVENLASNNPIDALGWLQANEDDILPSVRKELLRQLRPEVKKYRGRQAGAAAASSVDAGTAMKIAASAIGLSETGQKEALQKYLRDGGVDLDPEVTAWCAAFMNATLAKAGQSGTGSNMARSFLDWGVNVDDNPQPGDVVILERGKPPFGHVGFFEGYNEDGSIRITGGNQDDEVNTKSYSADRVLGFRRGTASGDGTADPSSALRELIAIEDPTERSAAISEYNLLMGVASDEAKAVQDAALTAGWQLVDQGGDINGLTFEQKQMIGFQGVRALQEYQRGLVTTDPGFSTGLWELYGRDPEAFKDQDPTTWLGKLSRQDYDKFVELRAKVIRGDLADTIKPPTVATMMSEAATALERAKISDDAGKKDAFQNALIQWATENPKEASDANARRLKVNSMLLDVLLDPPGLRNKQSGKAFEIDLDGSPMDTADDVTVEVLKGSTIKIGGTKVPDGMIDSVINAYIIELGREPTPPEIMDELINSPYFR